MEIERENESKNYGSGHAPKVSHCNNEPDDTNSSELASLSGVVNILRKCRKCSSEYPLIHYEVCHNKNKSRRRVCRTCRNDAKKGNVPRLLVEVLSRARCRKRINKNVTGEFTLTKEDMLYMWNNQKGKCALTGDAMSQTQGDSGRVSIDRIDSKSHYTRENCQLVTVESNFLKRDICMPKLLELCKKIVSKLTVTLTNQ